MLLHCWHCTVFGQRAKSLSVAEITSDYGQNWVSMCPDFIRGIIITEWIGINSEHDIGASAN